MRILITRSGENIFSEEEKRDIIERKFRSTTTNKLYQRKMTIVKYVNKRDKKIIEEKPAPKNYFVPPGISMKAEDFFSKTTSTFYPKKIRIFTEPNKNAQFDKYRKIRINMQKITFPKELQAKYEIYKMPENLESNNLYEKEPSKLSKFTNPNYKFSLRELIDNKTVFDLKNEILKQERVRERLSTINEQNFRTNYAYLPRIKELNEILNYKKIKGDKIELIKYINSHNKISDVFLKNIVTSDKVEIEKFDKISQTLLFNKDADRKIKSELERKVKSKQNLNKLKIASNLMKMSKEVKLEEKILDKYQRIYDKKSNYLDKHKEIQKEWKRKGIKYLASKSFMPRKPYNNLSELTNIDE